MRQAILTYFVGPTNFRGSRIVAKAQAGRIVLPWDDALDVNENHERAAKAYAAKLGWKGRLVSGGLPDGSCCHVFAG